MRLFETSGAVQAQDTSLVQVQGVGSEVMYIGLMPIFAFFFNLFVFMGLFSAFAGLVKHKSPLAYLKDVKRSVKDNLVLTEKSNDFWLKTKNDEQTLRPQNRQYFQKYCSKPSKYNPF